MALLIDLDTLLNQVIMYLSFQKSIAYKDIQNCFVKQNNSRLTQHFSILPLSFSLSLLMDEKLDMSCQCVLTAQKPNSSIPSGISAV